MINISNRNCARVLPLLVLTMWIWGCEGEGQNAGDNVVIGGTTDAAQPPADTDAGMMNMVSEVDDDGDGLSNQQEAELGTNPENQDSDGDGYSDGAEVQAQTDPTDPDSRIYQGGWPYNSNKDDLEAPSWDTTPMEGSRIPRYQAPDQFGDLFDLYDLAGHGVPIVLDLATWGCRPCKAMAQYFSDGDPSVMDDFPWWNERYNQVLDMINRDEIIWITVLWSGGQPVDQEEVARWEETFPHGKVIVLADTENQLSEWLEVHAMPHIDILDENLNFLVYDVRGPTRGMRYITAE